MDDSSSKQSSSMLWLFPVSVVVVLGAVLVGWMSFKEDEIPPGPAPGPNGSKVANKLTRDESLELLLLRDRALGNLENGNLDQAETLLQEISRKLPDDPFGPRNLAICRDLIVESLNSANEFDKAKADAKKRAAIQQAQEAVDKLLVAEPTSPVPHVLAARVALKQEDTTRAATALHRATQLSPTWAPAWYDLFLLEPLAPGELPSKETIEALRKVRELEPDNLFVLKDWLLLQTQLKEPSLANTIAEARKTLEPFASTIKTNLRQDVPEMLDNLQKAVEAKDWPLAERLAMRIKNVILPEANRDQKYVQLKSSMEYSLLDFGHAFYESADRPETFISTSSPVTFAPSQKPLALSAGARAIVAADLEFDGELDGAALVGNQLIINFSLASTTENAVITLDIGEGFSKLITVDVDDDVDGVLKPVLKKEKLADLDLIAFGSAGIKFFENLVQAGSQRGFAEKSVGDNLAALRNVRAVVPADLDLDGDVDFVTLTDQGVQMWSNRGNWTFDDITSRTKLPPGESELTSAVAVDWDRDSDLDLLIATADGLGLLENLHHGQFRWRALDGEFTKLKGATSLLIEQLGTRPSWSVIGAGPHGIHAVVTQTSASGAVSPTSATAIDPGPVKELMSLDFDNDGLRDLLAVNESAMHLWQGFPGGKFEPYSVDAPKGIAAATVGDLDRDGDEDLLISTAAESAWLANDGGNANGWLNVTLVSMHLKPGEQNYTNRVNKLGIGSMIEVRSGARYQAQVAHQPQTHFGLGPQKSAEVMRILWTNGLPQNVIAPMPNQLIYEEQILIGSCPYLYTWDGEKFAFFTDLLWNAPLGLKFAEDVIAPWREWEYLKIDGDRLRPKDGTYPLRITAELWEIEYFDQVKLFAVDHPAGTQIFTNEKVGPESLAAHKIHTVSAPHSPVAARDQHGKDILDQVQTRDGVYTKSFDHKLAQGLTTEHYLELDLGTWPAAEPKQPDTVGRTILSVPTTNGPAKSAVVTLFLTGWMYPGSTSLRVQQSQNPDLKQSQPPSLHAVDANGHWREVRPFMGFPGGKTKTIAVDISDIFPPDSTDHRLRIVTNMEFYWDAAFFTVDDNPVRFHEVELPLAAAKLVDRGGVSLHSWPVSGNGPDQFDYQRLVPGDAWPPIEGAFTRFGDVLPLLTNRDDHLVVLHPGDEMQLEFAVPKEPPPDGWVRDFVIYNVGWDKDCDQNTVYGESSEPLPFQAMTIYPHLNGAGRPMDEAYSNYLKTYQTRTRARGPFWNKLSRN